MILLDEAHCTGHGCTRREQYDRYVSLQKRKENPRISVVEMLCLDFEAFIPIHGSDRFLPRD